MAASFVTSEVESVGEEERKTERVVDAVAEWEDLMSGSDSSEWEEAGEQEDSADVGWGDEFQQETDAGWDCCTDFVSENSEDRTLGEHNANFGQETSVEQEDAIGWDCHAAQDTDFGEHDSGYSSSAPSDVPSIEHSPNAIKYSQLPFKTKHHFLTYIQRILEATCLRHARQNLSIYLTDPQWKARNLVTTFEGRKDDRLVFKDWLAEDGIELECWMQMLARCFPVKKSKWRSIMESVIALRNAATHRGDRGDFGFEELSYAMDFPALYGDEKGEADIANAFRYIMEDPALDEDAKVRRVSRQPFSCPDQERNADSDVVQIRVEDEMFTPRPCTSHYQLLGRIQTMLEETCFRYAGRKIPQILTAKGWDIPEQVELQNWINIFLNTHVQHDESADTIFHATGDPHLLVYLIHGARIHIRNVVAHRRSLSHEHLIGQIHAAIKLCILQGDWHQAFEIEILAEGYLTNRSRGCVRNRLKRVLGNRGVDSPYERQRRIALAGFFEREVVEETDGGEMVEFERGAVERTWSCSMHECLKRVEVLEESDGVEFD